MSSPVIFPYVPVVPSIGSAGLMPMVPIELELNSNAIRTLALVDSGSTVNVIPYQMGLHLGGDWNQYPGTIPLGGMLSNYPAKPLMIKSAVQPFAPVLLAFAWSQAPTARLILGQTNFFMEFDVCFFRSQSAFQVQPRKP